MIKNKIAIALASLIAASSTYASFPQQITVCLKVNNNKTPNLFAGRFKSTDFATSWFDTAWMENGQDCVSYTYDVGPKKISIAIRPNVASSLKSIHLSQVNCNFKEHHGAFVSGGQETSETHEKWNLTLKQQFPEKRDNKFYYTLTCQHSSY